MGRAGAIAACALAASLAACGSPSKEEWVAQMDGVCQTRNRQLDSSGFTPQTTSSFSGTGPAEDAARAVESANSRMAKLKPPEEVKSQGELYLGQMQRVPAAINDVASNAKADDQRAQKAASADLRGVTNESERLAGEAGLKSCSEPTPTLSR